MCGRSAPDPSLCLPIVKQTKLIGVLYLENNLTPRAFTSERIAVLELLASQAAISLENARLYSELQRSEDRLRSVINTIPAHAWSATPDGYVDFFSQRLMESTGRSVEDLLGWGWGSLVHPDDLAGFLEEWREALAVGEPMEGELRLRLADGDCRWVLTRNVPLRDELGNITRWYGVGIEIEDRKRAEEQRLRQAQVDLVHISRVTTMGELTASLAHEINQPITGTVTDGNACLRWLAADPPNLDEARDAARRIVRDGKRAGDIIARIRALATKTATAKIRLDMNQTIQEVIALVRDEMRRNSVTLGMELANDLSPVLGDRVQLQQVLLNLIMNGVEAMSTIEERSRKLVIRTQNEESRRRCGLQSRIRALVLLLRAWIGSLMLSTPPSTGAWGWGSPLAAPLPESRGTTMGGGERRLRHNFSV